MGCDIHLKAEVKKDGVWQVAEDPTVPCDMCDGTGIDENGDPNKPVEVKEYGPSPEDPDEEIEISRTHLPPKTCYWCRGRKERQREFWDGRCYDLFAILANVRNGRGFAGCVTGDGFNPMTEERGIPPDVSDEGRTYLNRYGEDGHSHTYMTMKEILDYDWEQVSWKEGVVGVIAFKAWLDQGKKGYPPSYCGDVSGPNIVKVSPELMEEKILKGEIVVTSDMVEEIKKNSFYDMTGGHNQSQYYTSIRWATPYSEVKERSGFDKTIELLKNLDPNPENVRLIMFFDN